jgi:hypothetical protein
LETTGAFQDAFPDEPVSQNSGAQNAILSKPLEPPALFSMPVERESLCPFESIRKAA